MILHNSKQEAAAKKIIAPAIIDRRQQILNCAEQLFAERGYYAVSIREIALEANVQFALVGYYFGAKKDLYYSVFERLSPIMEDRMMRLKKIMVAQRNPTNARRLREILTAFVAPVLAIRRSPQGRAYGKLVARGLNGDADDSERVVKDFFDPLAKAYIDAINACYPNASIGQCAWAYQFALGALIHHITDERIERLSNFTESPDDPNAQAHLINFLVDGIRAVLKQK